MKVDEFDTLQPAQNYPKHVIVGLRSQAKRVFAEVKGSDLGEVKVDGVLPLLILNSVAWVEVGAGLPSLCHCGQCCRYLSAHDGGSPIDSVWPLTLPDGVEV